MREKVVKQKIGIIAIYILVLFYFFSFEIYVKAEEKVGNVSEEFPVGTNGEYVFFASESEAKEIAETLGGWLSGYSHGIATIIIPGNLNFYYDSDDEIRNPVLEYNGVKIYPDMVVTVDNEEGVFVEQEYLIDLGVQEAWNVARGQGVNVAVIDSGVDASHEELAHAIIYEGSVIPEESYGELLDESYKGNFDHLGHGTHVAGIIAASDNGSGTVGIAPDSSIISIKALEKRNGKGYGKTSWIAMAIVEAVERNADVINLSIGGTMVGDSVLHEAVQYAYDANVPVVCAAGNNSSQRMFYPAAYAEAIAVSAVRKEEEHYVFDNSYSNFGSWIDFCAPGTNIYSTYPGGYRSMTGTSMACPMVTGAVALVLSKNPDFTIDQLITYLKKTAIDLGDSGEDELYGYGMVDMYALMDEFVEKPAPAIPSADIPSGHYLIEGSEIQLFTEPSDATIYYTMDGTEPTLESMVFSDNILIENVSGETVTIKAIAVSQAGIISEPGVFQYHVLPKQKELVHMSGEIKDDIFPLYGALKDEISGKECRKYNLLVPNGKKIMLSLVDSVPELACRIYEKGTSHDILIGDYQEGEQEVEWKNTTGSTKEILFCVVWNSDSQRGEDLTFSFQWSMEDFKKKEESVNNGHIEQEDVQTEEWKQEGAQTEEWEQEVIITTDTEAGCEKEKEVRQEEVIKETQDTVVVDIIQQEQTQIETEDVGEEQEPQYLEQEEYLETSSVEETPESQNNEKGKGGTAKWIFLVAGVIGILILCRILHLYFKKIRQ